MCRLRFRCAISEEMSGRGKRRHAAAGRTRRPFGYAGRDSHEMAGGSIKPGLQKVNRFKRLAWAHVAAKQLDCAEGCSSYST